jgi:GrpB-like predicted nucleotidyltransferase (UPF0157 family)
MASPRAFLSDPDTTWPASYQEVRAELADAVGTWRPQFEHIGSTSVADLTAKPLIDVLVGVDADAVDVPALREAFEKLGYRQASRQPSLGRRIFIRRGSPPSVNVHVVPYEGEAWTQLLLTRDLLRDAPEVAASYVAMKQAADAESGGDYRKYRARKVAWFEQLAPRLEEFHRSRSGGPLDLAALNAGMSYSPGEDRTPIGPATNGYVIDVHAAAGSQENPIAGSGVQRVVDAGGDAVEIISAEPGGLVQEYRDSDGTYRVDAAGGGSGSPSPG